MRLEVYQSDSLEYLSKVAADSIDLIYIDPPFNTRKRQVSARTGIGFDDTFSDYIGWIRPLMVEARRVLKESGTIYVHLDHRESYKVRYLVLDPVFGEHNYLSSVVWAYDFGGRGKDRWPAKHDDILVYAKCVGKHVFNWDEIERIPYMAPSLCGPEKAALGKVPTDVWWMSIVGTNSKERLGYPTQKPVNLVRRAVQASSPPGGLVLDFFAGSGTTGEACRQLNRDCILVDKGPEAVALMKRRFNLE